MSIDTTSQATLEKVRELVERREARDGFGFSTATEFLVLGEDMDRLFPSIASLVESQAKRIEELEADKAKLLVDIKRIRNAFMIEGSHPQYHRQQKELLRKKWRTLYDALSSLSYTDPSKEEIGKACLEGDDDACDQYVKLHPESIVKSQDIPYTDSPSQQ